MHDTTRVDRRPRRTGAEVRARLLSAARETFAERGYAASSTKEIARRADVTEVLLFRHYGTKAGIFTEAVIAPVHRFVEDYERAWAAHLHTTPTELIAREYIDRLFGFLNENRDLFVALLDARSHHPDAAVRLSDAFGRLQMIVADATREYNFPDRDPALIVRLTFGLVLSAVIHGDVLFASLPALSQSEFVDELTRYMMHGISHPD